MEAQNGLIPVSYITEINEERVKQRQEIQEYNKNFQSKAEYFSKEEMLEYDEKSKFYFKSDKEKIELSNVKITKKIGEGAFGEVYKGVCKDTGLKIAIKKFKPQCSSDQIERIKQEIEIQGNCAHKNIVSYYGYKTKKYKVKVKVNLAETTDLDGHEQIGFQIYMEYMDQRSLADYMGNIKTYDYAFVSNVIKQVLLGLEYLHYNKIMHRDIKPQNILLKTVQETGTGIRKDVIKLADFGSSRIVTSTMNSLHGTIAYMAPEVL